MSVLVKAIQTQTQTRRSMVEVESSSELSTESLTLRTLGYADEPAFLDALERSRPQLRRWIPLEIADETPQALFHRILRYSLEGDQTHSACRRGIFLNDNTFAGMVSLIKIQRGLEWTAEINWWLDSAMTGRGIASKALETLMDHAVADIPVGLGIHKVNAMICLDNHASVRMAQKVGFKPSGYTQLLNINKAMVMHHEFVYPG